MDFNAVLFSAAVRGKRQADDLGLREVESSIGVSASTISRLENGKDHDISMTTFVILCNWLKVSPGQFFTDDTGGIVEITTIEQIEVMLRACPEWPEFCRAVAEVMRIRRKG